jgi:hypothetical protein
MHLRWWRCASGGLIGAVHRSQRPPCPAPSKRVLGRIVGLCILAGLIGCGPGAPEPETGPDFVQIDSAGVELSITRSEVAHTPLPWTVDPDPDLVVGEGRAPWDYLHQVQGLRGTAGGGVLAVDGGSQELRFFDGEGQLVEQTGGPGEGPGEFGDPVLVPVVGTDSLLVFDRSLIRSHVLSEVGEVGRLIHYPHGRPYGGRAPVGAVGFRHLLFNASGTAGGPETPLPDPGLVQLQQKFMWYDTTTGGLLTVDSVLVDHRYYDRLDGVRVSWNAPFSPRSSAVTTADGALITRGRPAEILDYDVDGRLRRVFRIDSDRAVTEEMIDAFIDLEHSRFQRVQPRNSWYRVYDEIGIPDTLPAFQALQLDELGWLWAEVYNFEPDQPRDWVVFDPEGRARGTVRTPPGLEIEWIGRAAVLGVWRDEFEVEHVHRHRLTREAAPGDSNGSADDLPGG